MPRFKDSLLPLLRAKYPGARYGGGEEGLIVTFTGPAEVGDLLVWEDGDEARVEVGRLTHTHLNGFGNYPRPAGVTDEQLIGRVTEEVLRFLEDFFAERIVVWTDKGTGDVCLGAVEAMPDLSSDPSLPCYSWKGHLHPKPG